MVLEGAGRPAARLINREQRAWYLGKPSARRLDGFSQIETHLEGPPG